MKDHKLVSVGTQDSVMIHAREVLRLGQLLAGGFPQGERLERLNQIAVRQMQVLMSSNQKALPGTKEKSGMSFAVHALRLCVEEFLARRALIENVVA